MMTYNEFLIYVYAAPYSVSTVWYDKIAQNGLATLEILEIVYPSVVDSSTRLLIIASLVVVLYSVKSKYI